MVEFLMPSEISMVFAIMLVGVSFFTSALTAAFGIGGGLALLAVMAAGLPVATLIPVHGVVQFGSNAGRAIVQRAHVNWQVVLWFCGGGLLGAAIGGLTVTNLPDAPMKLALAAFVLFMVWGPKPKSIGRSLPAMGLGGAVGGTLTMFFGATGPVTAAVLNARRPGKMEQVATFSVCMTVQHILKVFAFGLLGFAFADWVPLIIAMIATGFAGTLAGTALLRRMPEHVFKTGLNWLLTGLALWMAMQASLALH